MNPDVEEFLYRENLQLASFTKRVLAMLIDDIVVSILILFILIDGFANAKTAEDTILYVQQFLLEMVLVKVIYQTFFIMQFGATPGKMLTKTRVILQDSVENPTIGIALLRAIIRVTNDFIFFLGFIWGFFDPNRQTLHDKASKTLVIDA